MLGGVYGDPGLKRGHDPPDDDPSVPAAEPARCTAGDPGVFGKEGVDPE